MFGAGVDTAVNTLRWSILMMAKYPLQQRLVLEDISEALKHDGGDAVGMEHYEATVYTRVSRGRLFPVPRVL